MLLLVIEGRSPPVHGRAASTTFECPGGAFVTPGHGGFGRLLVVLAGPTTVGDGSALGLGCVDRGRPAGTGARGAGAMGAGVAREVADAGRAPGSRDGSPPATSGVAPGAGGSTSVEGVVPVGAGDGGTGDGVAAPGVGSGVAAGGRGVVGGGAIVGSTEPAGMVDGDAAVTGGVADGEALGVTGRGGIA